MHALVEMGHLCSVVLWRKGSTLIGRMQSMFFHRSYLYRTTSPKQPRAPWKLLSISRKRDFFSYLVFELKMMADFWPERGRNIHQQKKPRFLKMLNSFQGAQSCSGLLV